MPTIYKTKQEAIERHCRYGMKCTIPHPQSSDKEIEMSIINEPGLYSLILRSRKSVGLLDEDDRNTVRVMDSLGRAQNTNITNELGIVIENNRPVVSSRDIALVFEKEHKNVIRDIRFLECSEEFTGLNFELSEYKDTTGRTLPMYLITRDGFTLLAMGFNGARAMKFKLKYIVAFNAMEEQLKNPFNIPAGRLQKCLRRNTTT
ncbi:MAG: Rha family transcriptional regulator [Cloacibacillus sp.]